MNIAIKFVLSHKRCYNSKTSIQQPFPGKVVQTWLLCRGLRKIHCRHGCVQNGVKYCFSVFEGGRSPVQQTESSNNPRIDSLSPRSNSTLLLLRHPYKHTFFLASAMKASRRNTSSPVVLPGEPTCRPWRTESLSKYLSPRDDSPKQPTEPHWKCPMVHPT